MKSGLSLTKVALLFLLTCFCFVDLVHGADHPPVENCKVQNPDTGACSDCNDGFYINVGLNLCQTCEAAQTGCTTCEKGPQNQALCSVCIAGYFLVSDDKTCRKCAEAIGDCDQCTNALTCTKCQSTRYLSADKKQCISCTNLEANCVECSDENTCTKCQNLDRTPQGSKCVECSSKIADCNRCTVNEGGDFTCSQCGNSAVLDENKCIACATAVTNCLTCASKSECEHCQDSFFLDDNKKCEQCSSSMPNCAQCSDKKTCTQCASAYFPQLNTENVSECKLCSEKTTNCQECDKDGHCFKCDAEHVLSPKGACLGCFEAYPGCTKCDSAHCKACQVGLFLSEEGACTSCGSNCVKCNNAQGCVECASFYGGVGASCISFWWPISLLVFLIAFGFGLYFYNARKVSYEDLYTSAVENDGDILNGSKSLQDPLNAGSKSTKKRKFVDEEED